MTSQKNVTVLVIGDAETGKTQNGNAFLQKKNAFEMNSRQDSCSFVISAKSNAINGITRYYIDTPGIECNNSIDYEYIQQMISFLKEWKLGINAFFIIINYQCPRFSQNVQKIIKLLNDFFIDPEVWLRTGIIFTRCYPGNFDKNNVKTEYCEELKKCIINLKGCENINPQIPCFFVDSVNWETDESTKREYEKIFEFAHSNFSIPTQKVICSSANYKNKEEEILEKQLVNSELIGEGADKKRVFHYEDQKRYKITDWNNNVTYTEPTVIKSYTEEKLSRIEEEKKTEIIETREEVFKSVKSTRHYFLFGRRKHQVHDYYLTTTKYIEYTRKIIIDPDENVTYGDWVQTDIKAEIEKT